jgi:hypothetical protein
MHETRYGLRVDLNVPYEQALERIMAALQAEGFGVLTTIDVRQTLKQKLGRDFRSTSSSARAIRRWPTGRSTRSSRSACCCRAT